MTTSVLSVREGQASLREAYRNDPQLAWVVDHASVEAVDLQDPFHGSVRVGTRSPTQVGVAVHGALGGPHDAPCPGDLLCGALASCQEASLRMVANLYGVQLTALKIDVRGGVDVRGTLGMAPQVPVAFQWLEVDVFLRAAAHTPAERVPQILKAAERACVVLQTLRAGVPVRVTFDAGLSTG